MKARFEPELSGSSLAAANVALADPVAARGKGVFESQGCNACHGDNGEGTAIALKLIDISAKYDAEHLASLLKSPTKKMSSGGMDPPALNADEMSALVAYVRSLK